MMQKSIDFDFRVTQEDGAKSERTSRMLRTHDEANEFRKSKRTVRPPPKVDEIYSYERMKHMYQRNKSFVKDSSTSQRHTKKARVEPSSPERSILSVLIDDIPVDNAAASTLISENSGDVRPDGKSSEVSDCDDREWLEKVAASLGADTSTIRQRRLAHPVAPILKPSPIPNPQSNTKSDAASTCSTITCRSDNKTGNCDSDMLKQPPQAVLVSHMPPASQDAVSNILLSKYSVGSRHGNFVIHKNDKRGRVGEVILEHGDSWVEVAIGGTLKKYHITHLVVVPSKHSKASGPLNSIVCHASMKSSSSKKSRSMSSDIKSMDKKPLPNEEKISQKIERDKPNEKVSSPSEKKFPAFSVDHLFCWFCDICNAANNAGASECLKCNAMKTDKSKRSVLLGITESAVMDENAVEEVPGGINENAVEEVMNFIPHSDRASIPKRLIAHLLEVKSFGASNAGFSFVPRPGFETYFYWMCGYCTTQNSYKKTTCSVCLQGTGFAKRSPLLKIANDAAINSRNSDEALLLVPPHERMVIPKDVMDVLVTCVSIITSRSGQRRRCRKAKMDGFDYCEAHCDPLLLIKPRLDEKQSSSGSQLCNGVENPSNDHDLTYRGTISVINEVMPSFLSTIQPSQVNELRWMINSIEDSVLCGENAAFPLGMTIRKFFTNYGFHDGRIIKVVRKIWADSERSTDRPVLVYRCL